MDKLLQKGPVEDIFRTQQAFNLTMTIGEYADQINTANFGRFFGPVQSSYDQELILHCSRLFDQSSKGAKRRSLPAILRYIEKNSQVIKIRGTGAFSRIMSPEEIRQIVIGLPNEAASKRFIRDIRKRLPQADCAALSRVKSIRDNEIAHNSESTPIQDRARYNEVGDLLKLASKIVQDIAHTYLSATYPCHEDIVFASDAKRASLCMKRLFEKAAIIEPRYKMSA